LGKFISSRGHLAVTWHWTKRQSPDYSEYFAQVSGHALAREIDPAIEVTMESSRGCWWGQKSHCTFCGLNGQEIRFRSKSPERVISELSEMARSTGQLRFMMTDAIINHTFFKSVLPKLAESSSDYQLFYETKANLTRAHIELFRRAGVVHVQPGIESLDSKILALMRKGTTAMRNIQMLKYCCEFGINTLWNIIYGFPSEEPEAYTRMADLARSLTHLQPPSLVPLVLDRFSPYQQNPRAFGLENLGPPDYYSFVFPQQPQVREQLCNIAYSFEYRHFDGRDPESYVNGLRKVISNWQQVFRPERVTLDHKRGPDFLVISDKRVGLPRDHYILKGWQADAYLACDASVTPEHIARWLNDRGHKITEAELIDLLTELCDRRLMYYESGCYLSLSIPTKRRYPFTLLEM
jgi:ribosomal peptide maturation radical SAM protein 1